MPLAIKDTCSVEHGVDFFDKANGYPMGGNRTPVGRTERIGDRPEPAFANTPR